MLFSQKLYQPEILSSSHYLITIPLLSIIPSWQIVNLIGNSQLEFHWLHLFLLSTTLFLSSSLSNLDFRAHNYKHALADILKYLFFLSSLSHSLSLISSLSNFIHRVKRQSWIKFSIHCPWIHLRSWPCWSKSHN